MRGRKCALLFFVAEGADHRADHADAEGQRIGRGCALQFFEEDVLLHRRPAGAAIFLRPVRNRPALLVQNALPVDDVVLLQLAALDQLYPRLFRQGSS